MLTDISQMERVHPSPSLDTTLATSQARAFCGLDARYGLRAACRWHSGRPGQSVTALRAHPEPRFLSTKCGERQHGARSGGRSLPIQSRMRPNSSRGTATAAIWKIT